VASVGGLKRLQHLRDADRFDDLAARFEKAALNYEKAGNEDTASLLRLGAAENRKAAAEERMRSRWDR
jgi:hypothetical protein